METTDVPTLVLPRAVARALLEGEQVVDLRPASSPDADPPAAHRRVWLCPSGEEPPLKAAYRMARELSIPDEGAPTGSVRIEGWAEVVARGTARLDAERVAALNSKTVLDLDALARSAGEVRVVALRAHRLVEPLTVPAGLAGLPADPATAESELVLSDVAFEARLKGVTDALPGGLSTW